MDVLLRGARRARLPIRPEGHVYPYAQGKGEQAKLSSYSYRDKRSWKAFRRWPDEHAWWPVLDRDPTLTPEGGGPSQGLTRQESPSPSEKRAGDIGPLLVEALTRHRLFRGAVPIGSVARVSLSPMQVRMHPCALGPAHVLRDGMSCVPITAACEPERSYQRRHVGRRLRVSEGRAQLFGNHRCDSPRMVLEDTRRKKEARWRHAGGAQRPAGPGHRMRSDATLFAPRRSR